MKTFLEVFPDLHIAENVRGLLEMVGIEKISTNRDRSVHPKGRAKVVRGAGED